MNKTTATWLDVCILILMLAVSTVITTTSVSLIVGDTANIAQDKVLFDAGSLDYGTEDYKVETILLSSTRIDMVYPVDQLKVTYKDKGLTLQCDKNAVLDNHAIAKQIMSLRDADTAAELFYSYPISMHMSYEKDTGKYTCNIQIKEVV